MNATGKRVAILIEDGFEDSELIGPLQGLKEAGVAVTIVGPVAGQAYSGKRGELVTSQTSASTFTAPRSSKSAEAPASSFSSRAQIAT